jgi:hypothetical protein
MVRFVVWFSYRKITVGFKIFVNVCLVVTSPTKHQFKKINRSSLLLSLEVIVEVVTKEGKLNLNFELPKGHCMS